MKMKCARQEKPVNIFFGFPALQPQLMRLQRWKTKKTVNQVYNNKVYPSICTDLCGSDRKLQRVPHSVQVPTLSRDFKHDKTLSAYHGPKI